MVYGLKLSPTIVNVPGFPKVISRKGENQFPYFLLLDFRIVFAQVLGFSGSAVFFPEASPLFIFAYTYQNIERTHIVSPGCLHQA